MKKVLLSLIAVIVAITMYGVPAYPGWQTKTLADGTTIEVRQVGDEFYSFWETRQGLVAKELSNGHFAITNELRPTQEAIRARRAQSSMHIDRVRRASDDPQKAPKGVVILVNFADSTMKQGHDSTLFDNLFNATECTTNVYNGKNYGSMAQYFADQSNGQYRPQFDIVGPVTLPHPTAYYGEEGIIGGEEANDMYMADFVIDAVLAAKDRGCDFSQYDSDNDGYVDFVYLVYAGRGQSSGGESWTIWPHQWLLVHALYRKHIHEGSEYYYTTFHDKNLLVVDGDTINTYVCSSELDVNFRLSGIGTMCHEYSHVVGLPDLYDTSYGYNYTAGVTPGAWNIMDNGNYNGQGHCPPNYDPWEKFFCGWLNPDNLGNNGSVVTLHPNGTSEYTAYQVNESGNKQWWRAAAPNYYLEYRTQTGWDEYLPSHGLAVWRVDFNRSLWSSNEVNCWAGDPHYILDIVGNEEWRSLESKPVTGATEKDGLLTFYYIDKAPKDTSSYEPRWDGWAKYDDYDENNPEAQQVGALGLYGNKFSWGVMFPAKTLGGNLLKKVALYEKAQNNTNPITLTIYSGGNLPLEANIIYTETVLPAGIDGLHEMEIKDSVLFNPRRNLWITFTNEGDQAPAAFYNAIPESDENARWFSYSGANWQDVASLNPTFDGRAFIIRAYVEEGPDPVEPVEIDDEWVYYDNGSAIGCVGWSGNPFYWGVMFPAHSLQVDTLVKVAVYEATNLNFQPITIYVYSGGTKPMASNLIYSETVQPAGRNGFHEIELQEAVPFDKSKNLWIILNEGNDDAPAIGCDNTGDPNGRWISQDGITWYDVVEASGGSLNYTFMIRAYIRGVPGEEEQGFEWIEAGERKGGKLLYDGQLLIVRDSKVFNVLGLEIK